MPQEKVVKGLPPDGNPSSVEYRYTIDGTYVRRSDDELLRHAKLVAEAAKRAGASGDIYSQRGMLREAQEANRIWRKRQKEGKDA